MTKSEKATGKRSAAAGGEKAPPMHKSARKSSPGTSKAVRETGGPKGLEPTRYGDWERKGRCIDF